MSTPRKEVNVTWQGGYIFEGRSSAGGVVRISAGQAEATTSPMELLLLGVAGCSGIDVVSILEKQKQVFDAFQVRVRGRRAETDPKVYREIEVEYHLWGENLSPQAVERAITLSKEKYCSAFVMMQATATMHTAYRIYQPGEAMLTLFKNE